MSDGDRPMSDGDSPVAGGDQPATNGDQPFADADNHAIGSDQPANSDQPTVSMDQAGIDSDQPTVSMDQALIEGDSADAGAGSPDLDGDKAETRRGRRISTARRKPKFSIVGLFGELFITAGVLVFLFLGWQLWLNDIIVGSSQNKTGVTLAQNWDAPVPAQADRPKPADYGDPVVATAPANAQQFAVMYIPRFGADYSRTVSEGVGTSTVLDKNGIGHYPGTQMPGEVGNFAVAAHRTTHGAPFNQLATLQVGDKIYVQTQDGYYTYVYRGLEYVRPTGVGVLDPVPETTGASPTDRLMTMTSCNPKLSAAERIVGYASLDSWQPTAAGAPAAILATVSAKG
ncbi:MAG: class sortase [Microbacteriaceae bacterium]|nr:class sortase [Microbacteriaceae bacterium]